MKQNRKPVIDHMCVCVFSLFIYVVNPVVYRFHICEFSHSLKPIGNPEINTRHTFTVISTCA